MIAVPENNLIAEASLFARYLVPTGATSYQTKKYVEFHHGGSCAAYDAFDRFLLAVACSSVFGLWLADCYSGLFARGSTLRMKLVLMLAILECAPPSFTVLDTPHPGRALAWIVMTLKFLETGAGLLLGTLLFLPARAILAIFGGGRYE